MIKKENLEKTSAWPFVEAKKMLRERKSFLEKKGKIILQTVWAPWCGPCKTLGPALESAVQEANGAVKMAKVNVDENQMIAGQMRVQSIPTVYAFYVKSFQIAQALHQKQPFKSGLKTQSEHLSCR